jgi:sporulation protein YlmC with PRC-barrel domain
MIVKRLAIILSASTGLIAATALAQTQDQSTTKTTTQTQATGTEATGQPAQITVQQPPAQVEVRQGQPEILVHQPAPHIVVEIPQPEITVRMPQIEAQVKQAAPQVQVTQQQPKVEVNQAQQQSQVEVQQQGQPQIRYDMEQPKVEIKRAEGQPVVHFEQMQAGANQTNNTMAASNQSEVQKNSVTTTTDQNQAGTQIAAMNTAGAAMGDMQASKIINSTVYSAANENVGDINDIVIGRDGKVYGVVIGVGGFLGLGEKDVIVPMDRLQFVRDNNNNPRYVITASRQELEQAPAFDRRRVTGTTTNQ